LSEHDVAQRVLPESLITGCNVVLFEDDRTAEELFPLSVLRPSWEIRCGAGCLRHWLGSLESPTMALLYRSRPELAAITPQLAGQSDEPADSDADTVFLNGRLIGFWKHDERAADLPDAVADSAGRLLWARARGAEAESLLRYDGNELPRRLVERGKAAPIPEGWTFLYARYIWDYMLHNKAVLMRQFVAEGIAPAQLMGAYQLRELPTGVHFNGKITGYPVYIGPNVRLMPGVVLGNHLGPIWIGAQTEIEPFAYLEGPLYIGSHCRIKAGTRFYGGCALGPECRVAGEISNSVFQSHANKQHDGFLGSSVIGQWVNLGADTRNSNLRNDYGPVKVQVGAKLIETGERYIGLMCGDHAKTGINTMFNTGTVVGVGANVYGAGYPPRFVGSFQWGGVEGLKTGSLERTLEIARLAMQRRECPLSAAEEDLLRRHYARVINQETGS
jgi:UDP-N-acetylglucosamine diphosphorylase / glucose-1-phosphate thymidylyltransferase / UDP-N-acetylgalactosamine diphosphorylase / glucosamine-1-phosphate N-acetyltransferase / galactosamine-1-phosphate N-acetyltransferase